MRILVDYKYRNKSVCYKFYDDKNVYIISKNDLYKQMVTQRIKVDNAYIRSNTIVVKDKLASVKIKNSCPIPITLISSVTKPYKIDSIFGAMVTPEMLDSTALSLIEKIDKAKAERDVYKYGKFSTQFGVVDMYSLSSGCKTVSKYNYRSA